MPKKQKQKQKQKQSQKTSVVVNVGKDKPTRTRRARAKAQPAQRTNPQSISVVLQGSTLSVPPAPTQDYNRMVQELDYMRRQQASSGSLIPVMARNDLLNRVQATNPFSVRSTNTQAEMLNPYEGLMENQIEANTNIDAYSNDNFSAEVPIDQDFLRQQRIKKYEQNLKDYTKPIGVVEDVETISDLNAYDDEDLENRLAYSADYMMDRAKLTKEQLARIVSKKIDEIASENPYMSNMDKKKLIKEDLKRTPQYHQENVKKMMEKSLNKQWEQFLAEQEKEEKQKPFRTPVAYLGENDLVIPEGNYLVKDESNKSEKKPRGRPKKFVVEEEPKKDEGIKKYFKSQKK